MILVVGTGCSGTTAVARLLETRLGIDMGGPLPKTAAHPEGGYEARRAIVQANRNLVAERSTPHDWAAAVWPLVKPLEEPWGIKDPRMCEILSWWLDLLPEAVVLWVQRDLEETIECWRRRYDYLEEQARDMVTRRHYAVGQALEAANRPHTVIEMVGQDEETLLAELVAALELEEEAV